MACILLVEDGRALQRSILGYSVMLELIQSYLPRRGPAMPSSRPQKLCIFSLSQADRGIPSGQELMS